MVVAGSDPVAGAGLQGDLKVVTLLGGYALTAVTAITVQDTLRVHRVVPLPPDLVAEQMERVLSDVGADGVKLGMLARGEIVKAVAEVLSRYPGLPVVADPVVAGTQGGELLTAEALDLYRERLLPLVTLLTPNLSEASLLTGEAAGSAEGAVRAARKLRQWGAAAVLIKGGHGEDPLVVDWLVDAEGEVRWAFPRLEGGGAHGTGCALASAVTVHLVQGQPLRQAVASGIQWVRSGLRHALALGHGQRLLHWPQSGAMTHHLPPSMANQ